MTNLLSVEIAPAEKIVRAVKTPFHVKKARLKPALFRSTPGTDEVSVMRHDFMGTDRCRAKAKEIAADTYVGLAVLTVEEVAACGSTVVDSRDDNFLGHAHISHGWIEQPDEPADAQTLLQRDERRRALAEKARYYPDPDVSAPDWTGGALA